MRITTLAALAFTTLAIVVFAFACNNQTPPAKVPQPLPTQARFDDIDSAICAIDSMMNADERRMGEIQTGVSVDTKPLKPQPVRLRLRSPIDDEPPIYHFIESN